MGGEQVHGCWNRARTGIMAWCLEIALMGESVFSVIGTVEAWDEIRDSAIQVELIRDIDWARDWGAIYLVQPPSGPGGTTS
jgi:hypothetical protein